MAIQTGNTPANPFDHAFEMLGRVPHVVTEEVNADALEKLTQALTSRAHDRGRMILLRSPRAGFGKTHLLMRLHQRVAHSHEFIPLEPSKGKDLDAQSVLDAVLRRFSRILPAGGGLTVLDLLARRILACGLEPLVKSGEVPSQDRESALQALQTRPVETFDFHNEEAVTARWAMANFTLLGPRLTAELAERTHAGFRPVAWWVELLFRYSSAPVDQATRNSSLFETVFSGDHVETDMHEKLVALLNLTGLVTSPVLILDEVEGFSSNPEAALQVATFLNALHQSCEKLALIISVNGDVWETAFLPRIPCGLKDRLSDIVVDLEPMDKEVAMTMLRDRAGDMAESIAEELDFDSGVIYARGVIRCARNAWPEVAVMEDDGQGALVDPVMEPISLADQSVEVPPVVPADLHPPEVVIPDNPTTITSEPASTEPAEERIPEPEGIAAEEDEVEQLISSIRAEPGTEDLYTGEQEMPDLSDLPQPFAQQEQDTSQEQSQPAADEPSPFAPAEQAKQSPAPPVSDPPPSEQPPVYQEQQPDIPQPFAQQAPATPPTEPLEVPPQNVVNSPFSIDTSAPAQSPFQPAEPPQVEPQPEPQVESEPVQTSAETDPAPTPTPHTVTDNDREKVEDLLKQFRDRYGRD